MHVVPSLVFASAFAASTAIAVTVARQPPSDRCALPANVSTSDSTLVARAMACRDVEAGRITMTEYRSLIGLDVVKPVAVTLKPGPQWASSVRAVSSEWSPTSWSGPNVLGAPDVYPAHGDLAKAWASREPDGTTEFIEVGFSQPTRATGLSVVETFNPGAISSIELITVSGDHIQIGQLPRGFAPSTESQIRTFETVCTDEPIVAARVTIDSNAVPGWNEIDAIGLVGCQ